MFSVVSIGTNTSTTTSTVAITVGAAGVPAHAAIFVAVTEKSTTGVSGTLADSASNSYTTVAGINVDNLAANGRGTIFGIQNAAALVNGNTITYTLNTSAVACAISAIYVVGHNPTGSSFTDAVTSNNWTGANTNGNFTPTANNDLMIGVVFSSGTTTAGGNGTFTQANSLVAPPNEANTGGNGSARVDGGFKVLGSGTSGVSQTYAPTFSNANIHGTNTVFGVFLAAAPAITYDLAPAYNLSPRDVWNRGSYVDLRTWSWRQVGYLGQDKMTAGFRKEAYDLPPAQMLGPEPNPYRSWTFKTFSISTPSPAFPPLYDLPPTGVEPNWRRSWEWSQVRYIGKDVLPFKGPYDLPAAYYVPEPNSRRDWEWRQVGFLGLDVLPFRNDHALPAAYYVPELNPRRDWEWRQVGFLGLDKLPFRNDHILPPAYFIQQRLADYSWILGLNLALNTQYFALPTNWGVPDTLVWYQDWHQSLVLTLPEPTPFNQTDWPNPYPVQWYKDWNWRQVGFLGLDVLPNRLKDFPNPQPVQWYKDWEQNLVLNFFVKTTLPFNQYDWPLPRDYQRLPNYTWLAPLDLPLNTFYYALNSLWGVPDTITWYQDWNQNLVLIPGPPAPTVTVDLHFKPHLISIGRMGYLGGVS